MSDKLRCEIVQDLLPSYVDGLTSDETNEAVKDHLADCVSCRDMYERMKADETSAEENSEVMEKEKKEINFSIENTGFYTVIRCSNKINGSVLSNNPLLNRSIG